MKSFSIVIHPEENPRTTAQQKGETVIHGRIHHYEKKKVTEMRRIYKALFTEALKDVNYEGTMEGPIEMKVVFFYGTKDKKKINSFYKDTRPDVDNIVKLFLDVATDIGIYGDDSQITTLTIGKRWAEKPRITIDMKEVRWGVANR